MGETCVEFVQFNLCAKSSVLAPDYRRITAVRSKFGPRRLDEMHTIRGKVRLSWRILKALNLALLSVPERLSYEVYHAALDARLWRRWQHFQRSYVSDYDHAGAN